MKVRFVEREVEGSKFYQIQRKTWFGWRYMKYIDEINIHGPSFHKTYSNKDKEELLKEVTKCGCYITEYPPIRIYSPQR